MSDFKPGDRINITIEGAEVTERGAFLVAKIHPPEGNPGDPFPTEVPIGWSNVTVERGDPEWWPPQPGDLVRFEGRLLFAVAKGSNVTLTPAFWAEESMEPPESWERRHDLTLVHREEASRG